MKLLACAVLVLGFGCGMATAGTASGGFRVNITLQHEANASDGGGICVSASLSARTNALVRVVCQSGHFVDISPFPGRRFAGTHGGAFRFSFGPGHSTETSFTGSADTLLGTGTVTAMRIYHADEESGPLEMLVSF